MTDLKETSVNVEVTPSQEVSQSADAGAPGKEGSKPAIQPSKSVMHFAALKLSEVSKDADALPGAALSFKEVTFSVKVNDPDDPSGVKKVDKIILENAWGHIESGQLVALMGPSGCGKSTLLDILAKKKSAAYSGTVYLNGREVDGLYKRIISYVSQTDPMPQRWKVNEAVAFNAGLKQPHLGDLEAYVEDLLKDVGLLHVKDSNIGGVEVRGISGGQRRRVSLARGMAAKPALMFCDEPTSGLSATDAELIVKALSMMTKRWGITILVVIHQPRAEVAQLFDRLILLTAQPGRIVYNGPMADAEAYWASLGHPVKKGVNPTDFFLDKVTHDALGAAPEEFAEAYEQNELPKVQELVERALASPGPSAKEMIEAELLKQNPERAVGTVGVYGSGRWAQLCALSRRKLNLMLQDKQSLGVVYGAKLFQGFFVGTIYYDVFSKEPQGVTQMSFLMMVNFYMIFGSLMVFPSLFAERTITQIETSEALYGIPMQIVSQSLIDCVFMFAANSAMIVIAYYLGGAPWDKFLPIFVQLQFMGITFDSVAYAVGSFEKSAETATAGMVGLCSIYAVFSGFIMSRLSSPSFLKWMLTISPVHWCMEIMSFEFWGSDPRTWTSIERLFGFEAEPSVLTGALVNLAFIVVFRSMQIICSLTMHKLQK